MEGTGEGVWILMLSEVTLFEYNVSTIVDCRTNDLKNFYKPVW